jgi:hypothetical protein
MVQLVPGARVAAQLLLWAKSPLMEISEISRVASPLLLKITACEALVVDTT